MHIVTWLNKMDAWGYVAPEAEWTQHSWSGQTLKSALYRIEKLEWLKGKGKITNIKHIFEE